MTSPSAPGPPAVTSTHVMAGALVSDLVTAEAWYTTLFGRAPQTRPVEGLLEWYLPDGSGVQVHRHPSRAGFSSLVLGTDDLDARSSTTGVAWWPINEPARSSATASGDFRSRGQLGSRPSWPEIRYRPSRGSRRTPKSCP